ncbi:MAG: epimerase [bacterium]|nr:epimerase [bacterium]
MGNITKPIQRFNSEEELDDSLSTPTERVVECLRSLEGDLLILGAGGKMGPTLAIMARRALPPERKVIAVSRFLKKEPQLSLLRHGVETISCDLMNRTALDRLPKPPNVIYMAGRKFGSHGREWDTWAMNVGLSSTIAERFYDSRIAAFSTGNVYPFVKPESGGSRECDPLGPVGEYAQSCLGRERIFEHASHERKTPCVLLRLNYACEARYGVLSDIARKVFAQEPIDLRMGYVNVIWQGDAAAYALCALTLCDAPPAVLNIAGPETLSVRTLAEEFGARMGLEPRFVHEEEPTALLNNAAKCVETFGPPGVGLETMLDWISNWLMDGKPVWNKATRYDARDGRF